MYKRIIILSGAKPFEIMTLLASALLGALYLGTFAIDPLGPSTIHHILVWIPIVIGWYLLLLIGGVVGLVGVYWRNVLTGMLIERIGLSSVAFAISVYVLALFTSAGLHALGTGILLTSLASACVWRITAINHDLKRVNRQLDK